MSADTIELLVPPTGHPTWEEILERGYIVSGAPRTVEEIQNPDEFAAIQELGAGLRLEGHIDLRSPHDSIRSGSARLAPPLVPILETIANDALKINPSLIDGSPMNNSWQFRVQVSAEEPSVHMDSVLLKLGKEPKRFAERPEGALTYTVGTSGSLFYPKRYDFPPLSGLLVGHSRDDSLNQINALIRQMAQNVEPQQAKPFMIVQFNGITQHSADFRPKPKPGSPPPGKRRVLVASFGY